MIKYNSTKNSSNVQRKKKKGYISLQGHLQHQFHLAFSHLSWAILARVEIKGWQSLQFAPLGIKTVKLWCKLEKSKLSRDWQQAECRGGQGRPNWITRANLISKTRIRFWGEPSVKIATYTQTQTLAKTRWVQTQKYQWIHSDNKM